MNAPTLSPRITVIIPNLNQDFFLERAICSVLDQNYDNLELIVMDGGSTDSSLDIIESYKDEIEHWQSTWDSGPAEAVNTALSWATGTIVGILDADDAYLPHALNEAAKVIGRGADWAVGQVMAIDEYDEDLGRRPNQPADKLASFLLSPQGPLASSAVFYRTDLLKKMGGFDSEMRLAYSHEMHVRLYAAQILPAIIRPAVAAVREHEMSLTSLQNLSCGHEYVEAAERYANHLPPTSRYLLWKACEETRRIFATADLQIGSAPPSRTLWQQLLKRPAWLADADYRQKLLKQIDQDVLRADKKPAARRKAA